MVAHGVKEAQCTAKRPVVLRGGGKATAYLTIVPILLLPTRTKLSQYCAVWHLSARERTTLRQWCWAALFTSFPFLKKWC